MADANETETTEAAPVDAGAKASPDEIAFLRAENKKAFDARQKAKAEAEAARNEVAALKKAEKDRLEQIELDKATKAGEFDKALKTIVEKHQAELTTASEKASAVEQKYRKTLVGRAFADATDLFGAAGKYIYPASDAEKIFGDRVKILEDDSLVVLDSTGEVIRDSKTGRPATFAAALSEYIDSLPDKQYRLRGSGKTGSGSSGGSTAGSVDGRITDFSALTPEQRRDPKVLEQIRRQQPRGGMVFGRAYEQ